MTTDSSVLGNIPVDGYSYVVDSTVGAPEGMPVLSVWYPSGCRVG